MLASISALMQSGNLKSSHFSLYSKEISQALTYQRTQTCSITVSAPGKALIAGGYLVLEPSNIGITISSTSRFYSTVAVLVSIVLTHGLPPPFKYQ